jgi:hypothetical protein
MVDASPLQAVSLRQDSVRPAIPVLTDTLLSRWHAALIRLTDTLVAHQELQQTADLAPLMDWLMQRAGKADNLDHRNLSWDYLLPNPIDTAKVILQDGMPGFPISSVVHTLTQSPALVGALQSAHLTPVQFVTTTSALVQVNCYMWSIGMWPAVSVRWPLAPASVLAKNVAFIHPNPTEDPKSPRSIAKDWNRLQRVNKFGLYAVYNALKRQVFVEALPDSTEFRKMYNESGQEIFKKY